MPRLAIIIPAVGNISSLETTLVSVLENRPANCEILVALTAPYHDPYDLKDEVRFLQPARRAPLTATINQAVAETRAPFVHLLASGCEVAEGWTETPLAKFGDRQIASIAPIVWNAGEPERIVTAGVGYRASGKRFLLGQGQQQLSDEARAKLVGPSAVAGFYRKAALETAGGFSTQLDLAPADIDLALIFRRAGFTSVIEPNSRVLATGDLPAAGGFRRAQHEERLFWRNRSTAPSATALAGHVGRVGLEALASFGRPRMLTQLVGRTLACCQFGSYARHRQRLEQLDSRSVRPAPLPEHMRVDPAHAIGGRAESASARVASR